MSGGIDVVALIAVLTNTVYYTEGTSLEIVDTWMAGAVLEEIAIIATRAD